MKIALSLLAGLIFGAGLAISDMVNPARILNFLDVAGNWDPTLLFVMGGALSVTTIGYKLIFSRNAPLFEDKFYLPTLKDIDLPLVGGAAMFGIGWGLGGFCPGPAFAAMVTMEPKVWAFVATMLIGIIFAKVLTSGLSRGKAG